MKKLESSFMNMVLSLTGFTLVAGALLGWVNQITAEPIAEANAKTLSNAIAVVVPGFDNDPVAEKKTIVVNGVSYIIYPATKKKDNLKLKIDPLKNDTVKETIGVLKIKEDTVALEKDLNNNETVIPHVDVEVNENVEFIGAAVETSASGFGGNLTVLVGFDTEGNIIDYSLLSHAETPGLGSKAADWFKKGGKGDITGKNPGEKALTVSKDGGDIDAITASTITSRAFLLAVNNAYKVYKNQNVDAASGATKVSAQEVAAEPTDSVCVEAETTVENK